eukprot:6393437-Pyramimonas_sp.AAC.1
MSCGDNPEANVASNNSTDTEESPSPTQSVSAQSPTATAAAEGRAAMVAELTSLMQTLALGRSCDASRM